MNAPFHRLILAVLLASATLPSARAADPVAAKITRTDYFVYAQRPMILDGSGSTQGEGVTYLWSVVGGEKSKPAIDDADKATAHFTPPSWGVYTPFQDGCSMQR